VCADAAVDSAFCLSKWAAMGALSLCASRSEGGKVKLAGGGKYGWIGAIQLDMDLFMDWFRKERL
jgi:hypothetical protein